jgi:hypothetical protein
VTAVLVVVLVLGAVLAVGGLPALVYASVRTGDLARVEVADGALVVRPRGLNRLWALKAEVRVPLSQVSDVRAHVSRRSLPSGLRMPGTSVPGLIQAGTYRAHGQRSFWLVGRTSEVTVVDCPGGRFDRLVLQLGDEEVAELRRAVGRGSS